VDKEDVPRLDEGECLNDNLIGYGLRYLFNKFSKRHDDLHKRVYLHNSFFYEKLKAGRGTINYDGVKSWTAKVDLLSYDYIVVPVNEHYHWWVAIICNPGRLDPDSTEPQGTTDDPSNPMGEKADGVSSDVEMTDVAEKQSLGLTGTAVDEPSLVKSDVVDLVSDDKNVSVDLNSGSRAKQSKKLKPGARTYNFEDPRIITLDSLGSSHSPAIAHLKKYLLAEFEHKRSKIIKDIPQNLGMKATNIPEQNNLCDCGVYLLGYIQEFVKNPDLFVQTLLRRERPDWDFNPSELRGLWRDTITFEHKMYQEHQLKTEQKRREALAAKRTPKGSAEPSRQPSRAPSEVHSAPNGKHATGVAPSEQPTPVDAAGTPTNPAAREVDSPSSKQAPHDLHANSAEQSRPSTPAPVPSPQQTNLDADVVVLPPKDDDAVLPSIEAPDVEEVPAPPRRSQDEPVFIDQLPSSSSTRGADDDGDTIMEVAPSSFYSSHNKAGGSWQNRSALSSPAVGRGKRTARTRPKHTSSHFVVDGTPEFDSVVEKAEMVRNPEPIDLT
jgi:sentrin-specific protease 7